MHPGNRLVLNVLLIVALWAMSGGKWVDPTFVRTLTAIHPTTLVRQLLTLEQYEPLEMTLPVADSYDNPMDTAQVEVTVRFLSPTGARYNVPAFWMQPHQRTCSQDCAVELIKPTGEAEWRVRFSPNAPGMWSYLVEVRDSSGTREVDQGAFNVRPSARPGFIRVGQNRRYFKRENNGAYFPVGLNLGWSWSGARNTQGYLDWLDQLAASGVNFARLYIDVPWFIGLGWRQPVGQATAIQEDAWRLDTILQVAAEKGIALQVVLLWHQGWITYGGLPVNAPPTPNRPDTSADWASNPYNVRRGGAFATAAQYFTLPEGRALFKNRLRYIVARWGYSTSIFAWEVVDQVDRIVANNPETAVDWLREMVGYLREIDPYSHPITVGLRESTQLALLDPVVLDFMQVRYYQRRPIEPAGDQVLGALDLLRPLLNAADRPLLVNEFSLNPWFEPTADDPEGVHLRATMWASALAGAGGAASPSWWDTYIFPQNLTDVFRPLAAFTRGIPWDSADLRPIDVAIQGSADITYAPLRVEGYNATFGSVTPPDLIFRLTSDGVTPPINTASAYLYGLVYNRQNSRPQQYIITPPVDTRLTVNVVRTSDRAGARLAVIIDGKTVAETQLAPNSPPTSLTVPISAGEHAVWLDNTGDDYLQIGSIEVEAYLAPLRAVALADRAQGIFVGWIAHREYTWQNVAAQAHIKPVTCTIRAAGMPPGAYEVELWDPISGNVVGQETVTVEGVTSGELTLSLLPTARMLAVRAVRIAGPGNAQTPTPTPTIAPRN